MKILEICPYEPPASGWVNRIKLLRKAISERGGKCEILDIGPSRKLSRPDCISVMDGGDYLRKVWAFARRRFSLHCHINGEYSRGLLLALAACLIGRAFGTRCIVTFHAGTDQPFFQGWKRSAVAPLFRLIFALAHAVICNSESVKRVLARHGDPVKFFPIQAFSVQYLSYRREEFSPELREFIGSRRPLVSTYLCFRDGFFLDVIIDGLGDIAKQWPELGLVIVGTGDRRDSFEEKIRSRQLSANVFLAGDMGHDAFMTLLSQSAAHLRTPVTDGVSATVLEALSLQIPVVASDNGARPPSVVTYRPRDPTHLAERLDWVLRHHKEVVTSLERPEIPDTLSQEVDLLSPEGV
jgi:glycosyltransferase involved in cell wall biosynthesis